MSRSRSPIALDFGEHSVKALQLEQRGPVLRVRAAHAAAVDRASPATDRTRRMIESGRRALRSRGFRGKSAVVALRLSDVTTRHIRIPIEKLEQAGEIIGRQVQDHGGTGTELSICPIPVADLFDQGERKREFLCCIAKMDAIQQVIDVTEALDLVPVAIDLEPCALVRPYLYRSEAESFLHLDIGTDSTRITVVHAGATVLMRTARLGADQLQKTLEGHLQMPIEAVFDLGADPTIDPAELHNTVTGALAEPLEALLLRVADGVRYCGALFQGRAVNLMRISGGIAALPGLVPYLGRRIGITAELANPFAGILVPAGTSGRRGALPGFGTALGLALRGMQP